MTWTILYLIIGGLFTLMALSSTLLRRLPLSSSMLYLVAGITIGPSVTGLVQVDALEHASILWRLTEIAVIISLFSTGLKLSPSLRDPFWWVPVRLAFLSMAICVAAVAVVGHLWLELPIGAAILLGAILAPTDPVLASDVQLEHPGDRDRLRFGLTGEAALNDGSTLPFVMLGLGLLGLGGSTEGVWTRFGLELVGASLGGLLIGGLLGMLVGRIVLYLRSHHREAVGLDDFLALGLIALSYGAALLAHMNGFLAVFAAGLALRRIEAASYAGEQPPAAVRDAARLADDRDEIATSPETAPAYMARAVLGFNEQLERVGEVAVVLAVGAVLPFRDVPIDAAWFLPALFLVIRPLSVWLGLLGTGGPARHRWLMSWFGIRGIGSIFYLMLAIEHGLPDPLASRLTTLVLVTVAASVVLHGITVTPLMAWHSRREEAGSKPEEAPSTGES